VREQDLFSQYSDTWINAPFYTNHDMARSAGYYSNDESKTKMAGAMNLLMSGNAFVYYGEELGMKGSGKDENKRAPMYWSSDPEEAGMCDAPPGMDEVRMVFPSWAEQKDDPLSIYNYFKQAVLIRNAFPAIARGTVQPIEAVSGKHICAYVKHADGYQDVVIVINTGDEEEAVDAGALPCTNLAAVLNVSEEAVTVTDAEIRMPAYGIAVLTE
jgi:glycosidase